VIYRARPGRPPRPFGRKHRDSQPVACRGPRHYAVHQPSGASAAQSV